MANDETTTTAPVTPAPVAEASPVEHDQSTIDPNALQNALNVQANKDAEPEAEAEQAAAGQAAAGQAAAEGKSGEIFKPFGDVQSVP